MATRQVTNISKFVICVLAVAPSISWPQSKQETYEAAVLRLVEMAEESLGDTCRQLLSVQGRSSDEIDRRALQLRELGLTDRHRDCTANESDGQDRAKGFAGSAECFNEEHEGTSQSARLPS